MSVPTPSRPTTPAMDAGAMPSTEGQPTSPRWFELTILAQDPSIEAPDATDEDRKALRAKVRIPATTLRPGPRGPRLHVVDYDPATKVVHPPYELLAGDGTVRDAFADADDEVLRSDRRFHAQNVFAIAARTLAAFESALGRRVPWAFGSHQLYLVPHALSEPNAYYTDLDQALVFGDYQVDGDPGATCLSHDIVAHEATHAVLDGLRERFDVPGLPDQPAFHEAFADIVALLSVFSLPGVVDRLLSTEAGETLSEADVAPRKLRTLSLVRIGEELGDADRGQYSRTRRGRAIQPSQSTSSPGNVFTVRVELIRSIQRWRNYEAAPASQATWTSASDHRAIRADGDPPNWPIYIQLYGGVAAQTMGPPPLGSRRVAADLRDRRRRSVAR